ncbi:MAG: DivIVA domain-containing protein [Bacillota bacterium]|nr:DivIVA domain-containing protein [Bacillota bacterium]
MKLTSMEISNKDFKRSMRGYNEEEVEEFLYKIAEDYEILYKENSSLKEKISVLNEKVEHYSKIESTIQSTLILAQSAADQSKNNAQKEADIILKNANDAAQKIIDKANNDIVQINDDYERVKQDFVKFRAKFKNFMITQLDIFNGLENELMKNYNIGHVSDDKLNELKSDNDIQKDNGFKAKDVTSDVVIENNSDEIKSFFVND